MVQINSNPTALLGFQSQPGDPIIEELEFR
jgi:hypothetical protein